MFHIVLVGLPVPGHTFVFVPKHIITQRWILHSNLLQTMQQDISLCRIVTQEVVLCLPSPIGPIL
jgi:hypothetical protein